MSASSASSSTTVVTGFNLTLTDKDIRRVRRGSWLNDNIINFYMNLIIERGKEEGYVKTYAFNTFFYSKIVGDSFSSVRRWTRTIDLFSHDIVVVPIHKKKHWSLAVIDFRSKSIKYYDSLGGANKRCLKILKDYLQYEHLDKKGTDYEMTEWTLEIVKDIPKQDNTNDCGVFTCTFAEFICRDAPINFTQKDIPALRQKMEEEILRKRLKSTTDV